MVTHPLLPTEYFHIHYESEGKDYIIKSTTSLLHRLVAFALDLLISFISGVEIHQGQVEFHQVMHKSVRKYSCFGLALSEAL